MRIFKPFPSSVCRCCWLEYLGHVLFHLENYSRFCIVLSMKSFRSVLGHTRFWIFGGVHRKWKVSNTFLMSLITGPTLSLTSYQRHPVYRSVFITFTILLGDTFIQSSLYCICLGIKYLCALTVWAKEVSYCDFEALCPKRCVPFSYHSAFDRLTLVFGPSCWTSFHADNGISGAVLLPWQLVSIVPSPATGDDEELLMLDNRSRCRRKKWVKWSESTRPGHSSQTLYWAEQRDPLSVGDFTETRPRTMLKV